MKRFFLSVCFALSVSPVFAYTPNIESIESQWVETKYPTTSRWTPAEAERVLNEISEARSKSEQESNIAQKSCLRNFFANSCIVDVRKARMRAEKRFLAVEVRAKKVVRDEKNRQNALRQKEREAKAAQGPSGVDEKTGETSITANAKKREAQVAERKKMMAEKKAQEAENIAAYEKRLAEKKAREAQREERLKKRQKRKAEKEKQAAKK